MTITPEELLTAYEAEIASRGIPSIPEYRHARLDLMAGTLARLPPSKDAVKIAELEAKATELQDEIEWESENRS